MPDNQARTPTLDELLTCSMCGKKFIKINDHTYKPNCDCIKKSIRISVGNIKPAPDCKYLYADWCHHPDFPQENCYHYLYSKQTNCKYYEPEEEKK